MTPIRLLFISNLLPVYGASCFGGRGQEPGAGY